MAVREFQDIDLKQASKLAKLTWGDFYANESTRIQNFIYSFMVEYYDLNRKYSFSITDEELKAFLLAFTPQDSYMGSNFEDKIKLLTNKEQKTAIELFGYLEVCGNNIKNIINHDDIILGLFVSTKKGCGKQLLEKLKAACKKHGKKNLYLWTDTTCDHEYYKKNNFILCNEFETNLNSKTINTLIYRKEIEI